MQFVNKVDPASKAAVSGLSLSSKCFQIVARAEMFCTVCISTRIARVAVADASKLYTNSQRFQPW